MPKTAALRVAVLEISAKKPEGFPKHLLPGPARFNEDIKFRLNFIIHPVDYKHVEVTVSSIEYE